MQIGVINKMTDGEETRVELIGETVNNKPGSIDE